MKSKKIKHKFKEYVFSRKGGAILIRRGPMPQTDPTPEPVSNVVLTSNLNTIKNQLAQAFNQASPEILKSKLLKQMEILSGKTFTMKNETSTQNKSRKIISINDEESRFINKLNTGIIPATQIKYIHDYLKKLIGANIYVSDKYTGVPFTDPQMRELRNIITETQKGESSVKFNGYLRRMAAHIERGIDKFFKSDSKENKLKEIVKKLEIKKASADSAIQAANTQKTLTAYKLASKAIAEAAKAMQEAVDLMNTTRGGAINPDGEQIPTSNTSEIAKLKVEIEKQIIICKEKIIEMNRALDNMLTGDTIPDDPTNPAKNALDETINALNAANELFKKFETLVKADAQSHATDAQSHAKERSTPEPPGESSANAAPLDAKAAAQTKATAEAVAQREVEARAQFELKANAQAAALAKEKAKAARQANAQAARQAKAKAKQVKADAAAALAKAKAKQVKADAAAALKPQKQLS